MSGWKEWNQRKLGGVGLALAVVLFIALNVFSDGAFKNLRLDLTEDGLYTISEGTEQIVADLDEPITLRLFVSRRLTETAPALGTYADRVLELAERYVARSNGRIRLEVIDPRPFTPEEDRAVGFGLQGVPLDDAGELGFLGLVGTNTTDDQDVIAFLQPQREPFLEYDLTRLIYNLANPRKKVVGLISGIPIDADPVLQYKPWQIVERIKQFFEVESLGLDPKSIDDVDVLMVVHPFGLGDETLYAIDQYVMAGGKIMVFVDPFAEAGTQSNAAMRLPPDQGSDLDKLFEAWGIAYSRDKVLGDLGSAERVSTGADAYGRPVITDYVAWLNFRADGLKREDVVTGELEVVSVRTPGFVAKAKDATVTFEPLITSTEASAPVDAQKVRFQPSPAEILKSFVPEDRSLTLAARITGQIESAFPEGPPKPPEANEGAEKPRRPHLARSEGPANLIVVADSDILANSSWLHIQDFFGQTLAVPRASNASFVINALDNLSGTNALIGLRSRGVSERPFDHVLDIQKQAELKFRDRERALVKELQDIKAKLKELRETEKAGGGEILSDEQEAAIADFDLQIRKIRRELRDVRSRLREDIDRLDAWIKVLNIAAVPVLVALFAIIFLVARSRRMRRRGAHAAGRVA